MHLLDLPSELVLACLSHLPYQDLYSCLAAGNRLLRATILDSPLTLYHAEQDRAGVSENPYQPSIAGLSLYERRRALKKREANWLYFTPESTTAPEVGFFASRGVYWMAGDYWVIGDASDPGSTRPAALKFLRTTPQDAEALPEWRTASANWLRVIDFVVAPEELDLVALITYGSNGDNPPTYGIDIHLLSFSSASTPHPLAASPVIHVHDITLEDGAPSVTIDISGRTLAFCMLYLIAREESSKEGLYLYDWQTGVPISDPIAVHSQGPIGLSFLTPSLLMLSNAKTFSLDILTITEPDSSSSSSFYTVSPSPTFTHLLPALKPTHRVYSFQFRTLPNPPSASASADLRASRSHTRFLPRTDRALIQCAFETHHNFEGTLHVFVLHRARLVEFLEGALAAPVVPWTHWGPRCTRWLDASDMAMHPCTTLTGERLVSLLRSQDSPLDFRHVRIMNFNPWAVRVVRARIRAEMGEGEDGGDGEMLFMDSAVVRVVEADEVPASVPGIVDAKAEGEAQAEEVTSMEMQVDENPDSTTVLVLEADEMLAVPASMSGTVKPWVPTESEAELSEDSERLFEMRVDDDVEADELLVLETATGPEVPADPVDADWEAPIEIQVDDQLQDPNTPPAHTYTIASFSAFSEPILSEIPYVETISMQEFDYSAVEINNESVVGVRFGEGLSIHSIEVLHFG
ncbi:hypothetical protein C8F01DRAFT_1367530 [Mycena amicta]|nr:hypothetical protein C8F01DRAFT_1367530 [Mycena amicta]